MLLKLFWLFIKINFLTVSGPASVGLTKQLVVPSMMTENDFIKIASISMGIPGSDAIQLALQTGYKISGISGAIISVIGALIPCILLVSLVMIGMNFIPNKVLTNFFKGVTPALAILLVITAFQLFKSGFNWLIVIYTGLAILLFYLKIPTILILIICGFIGILGGNIKW
jgi:chromate transporter